MRKIISNNAPDYLTQLVISHQSHYPNWRNNLCVPRSRLDLFKRSILLCVSLDFIASKY